MRKLAIQIKQVCPQHKVIVVDNQTFNKDYARLQNLGNLLGATHAEAIKYVLEETNCKNVLVDKFGKEQWVATPLKSYNINLYQYPKAEEHTAVAAASILARVAFIDAIDELSHKYGLKLPLGASSLVDSIAIKFKEKYGIDELKKVVKISFKNTERVING